jgi:gamma-glutamyltranspeptidase/glutathione hydrolase
MGGLKNIVAAGDKKTAEAIKEVIKKGGNAFDGAVAGVFAAYMCEPALTSPGGGGFLMAYSPYDKEPVLYDFFAETLPVRVEPYDFFSVEVDFGDAVQVFHIGMASVAVPGVVDGLLKLHSERGRLPLEEVLKPALRYATEGVYLSKLQVSFVKLLEPIFTATEYSRKVFAPDGNLIDEKRPFKNHDYATFLELLVEKGRDGFYEGEIAQRIEELSLKHRGFIRKEDLQAYGTVKRKPLKVTYNGFEIFLNPPPSAGGILIAFTLELLNGRELGPWGKKRHISSLVEALKITNDFRRRYIDGQLHSKRVKKLLFENEVLKTYLAEFEKRLNLWGNTTHISISDAEGNVVSVTTTNGEGSGYVIPGYGVMLNNMMGEEDLNPKGFFKWPPHVRLPSMMCPSVVFKDGEPILALGSAGSNRIRSAIVQVLLNVLAFQMEPREAVDRPRLHLEGDTLYLEPGLAENLKYLLDALYTVVRFKRKSLFFGGVQVVQPFGCKCGADPRRGGYCTVF